MYAAGKYNQKNSPPQKKTTTTNKQKNRMEKENSEDGKLNKYKGFGEVLFWGMGGGGGR